jgi:outer membrane protein assembly factor BamE (lipoprotein component of BamABCDE complex)
VFKWLSSIDARFCVYTLVLIIALSGCGNPLPELTDIDLAQWEKDKNACGTYRKDNIEKFLAQKEKLLALKEMQIVELIGRPDRNELYKRNQKFFYYYLKPAPECANYNAADHSRLAIRFNAMGLAKEIMVE